MKFKTIIGILILVCVAITCLGIASATETIDGVEFNIPDGYKLTDQMTETPIEGVTHTENTYTNGNKNITIEVMSKGDSGVTIETTFDNQTEKTIKGYTGNYSQKKLTSFAFEKGDKHVVVSSSDAKLEDIII